jgi:hypothetical protein
MAMGINQIAAISGSLGGLLIGGWLASFDWRLVFLVSVPFGLFGTVWAYLRLHEIASINAGQHLDIPGNVTFLVGLTVLLVGVTYGIEPYGGSALGWSNPWVVAAIPGSALPSRAVQDPHVRRGQSERLHQRRRARRVAVHADHLAAGHLAPAARRLL